MGSKSSVRNMAKMFESSHPQQPSKSEKKPVRVNSKPKYTGSAAENLGPLITSPDSTSTQPRIRVSSPSESVASLQAKLAFNPAMLKRPTGAAKGRRCGSFISQTMPLPSSTASRRSKSESSSFHSAEINHSTLQRPKFSENVRRRPRSRSKFSSPVSSMSSLSSVPSAIIDLSADLERDNCSAIVGTKAISKEDNIGDFYGSSVVDASPVLDKAILEKVQPEDLHVAETHTAFQRTAEQVHHFQEACDDPIQLCQASVHSAAGSDSSSKESFLCRNSLSTLEKHESGSGSPVKKDINSLNDVDPKARIAASASKHESVAALQTKLSRSPEMLIEFNGGHSSGYDSMERGSDSSTAPPIARLEHAKGDLTVTSTRPNACSTESLPCRGRSPSNIVAALQAKISFNPDMLSKPSSAVKKCLSPSSSQMPSSQDQCHRLKSSTQGNEAVIVHESLHRPTVNRRRRPSQARFLTLGSATSLSLDNSSFEDASKSVATIDRSPQSSTPPSSHKLEHSSPQSPETVANSLHAIIVSSDTNVGPRNLCNEKTEEGKKSAGSGKSKGNSDRTVKQPGSKASITTVTGQLVRKTDATGSLRFRGSAFSSTVAALQAKLTDKIAKSSTKIASLKCRNRDTKSDTSICGSAIVHGSLQKPIASRRRLPSQSQFMSVDLSSSLRHRWDSRGTFSSEGSDNDAQAKPGILSSLQSKFSSKKRSLSRQTSAVDDSPSESIRTSRCSKADLIESDVAFPESVQESQTVRRWRRKDAPSSTETTTLPSP